MTDGWDATFGVLLGSDPVKTLQSDLAQHPILQLGFDILIALLVALVAWVAGRLLGRWLREGVRAGGMPMNAAILLSRSTEAGIWLVGIVVILFVFGLGLSPLAALIGVLGLAAGLALQQLLQNVVAGVYLLAERPYHIGDTISFAGDNGVQHTGRVEDVQMRVTLVRGRKDEVILVPNSLLFTHVITNISASGGYVAQLCIEVPRTMSLDDVRSRIFAALPAAPSGTNAPSPVMEVTTVGKDTWSAVVSYWVPARGSESSALWAAAGAVPEATVSLQVPG